MDMDEILPVMPGQRLARGVCRALRQFDFVSVEELVPTPGLRVDVIVRTGAKPRPAVTRAIKEQQLRPAVQQG